MQSLFKLFFISHIATMRPTLGHWQGCSLTYSVLITTLFQVQPEGYGEPSNGAESQSLTERISGIRARNLPIPSIRCYPTVSLSLKLYFYTPSQYYYSNFKQKMLGGKWFVAKLIQWCQHTRITIHQFK